MGWPWGDEGERDFTLRLQDHKTQRVFSKIDSKKPEFQRPYNFDVRLSCATGLYGLGEGIVWAVLPLQKVRVCAVHAPRPLVTNWVMTLQMYRFWAG